MQCIFLDAIESALTGTLFFPLYLSECISANIKCFFVLEKRPVPVKFTLKQFKKFCPQKKKLWGYLCEVANESFSLSIMGKLL